MIKSKQKTYKLDIEWPHFWFWYVKWVIPIEKEKKPRPLTIKQRKFVDEVVKSGNATDAAMKTYKCKNRNVARNIGPSNLAKPSIKESIEERLKVAKDMIYVIATTSEKDDTRLRACQDIVDRVEWKPTQVIKQATLNLTLEEIEKMDTGKLLTLIKK